MGIERGGGEEEEDDDNADDDETDAPPLPAAPALGCLPLGLPPATDEGTRQLLEEGGDAAAHFFAAPSKSIWASTQLAVSPQKAAEAAALVVAAAAGAEAGDGGRRRRPRRATDKAATELSHRVASWLRMGAAGAAAPRAVERADGEKAGSSAGDSDAAGEVPVDASVWGIDGEAAGERLSYEVAVDEPALLSPWAVAPSPV